MTAKSAKWLSVAVFLAGIALCYFVWLWHFLAVICVLMLLVGIGLCKRNLSVRRYHVILALNAVGLFPLLTVTSIVFTMTVDLLLAGCMAVKEALKEKDRKKIVRTICIRGIVVAACACLTWGFVMWFGTLRRVDRKCKVGETTRVCFPIRPALHIGYIMEDKSIPPDTVFRIVVKNPETGAEERSEHKGFASGTRHGEFGICADTEYLITLESDAANGLPYTLVLAWPWRASDPFFYGIHKGWHDNNVIK